MVVNKNTVLCLFVSVRDGMLQHFHTTDIPLTGKQKKKGEEASGRYTSETMLALMWTSKHMIATCDTLGTY